MATKTRGNRLQKDIHGINIELGKSWDLTHGIGWFCSVMSKAFRLGYGFHKTNKFTAVRLALKDL